ncbi:hypothetical protein Nepgr_032214 [Nepenthes gracilis]|uniref:Uncharacterized protein n=1 Tax=Nepenthes gracilis TaxID=150966 RepID=A0AAD3TJL0_NEPGR|nr:hypothetical protein Nepgr_032214 [Nepenthes gracilis]
MLCLIDVYFSNTTDALADRLTNDGKAGNADHQLSVCKSPFVSSDHLTRLQKRGPWFFDLTGIKLPVSRETNILQDLANETNVGTRCASQRVPVEMVHVQSSNCRLSKWSGPMGTSWDLSH